jgi:predicted  nucleic acid-binding Zn-ribbon protein
MLLSPATALLFMGSLALIERANSAESADKTMPSIEAISLKDLSADQVYLGFEQGTVAQVVRTQTGFLVRALLTPNNEVLVRGIKEANDSTANLSGLIVSSSEYNWLRDSLGQVTLSNDVRTAASAALDVQMVSSKSLAELNVPPEKAQLIQAAWWMFFNIDLDGKAQAVIPENRRPEIVHAKDVSVLVSQTHRKIAKEQGKLERLEASCKTETEESNGLKLQIEDLRRKIELSKAALEANPDVARFATLESEVAVMTSDLASLQTKQNAAEAAVKDAQKDSDDATQKLAAANAALAAASRVRRANTTAQAQAVAAANAELKTANEKLANAQKAVEDFRTENEALQKKLETMRTELESLGPKVKNEEEKLTNLEAELTDLNAKIAAIEGAPSFVAAQENKRTSEAKIQKLLQAFNEELERLNAELERAQRGESKGDSAGSEKTQTKEDKK